MSERIPVSARFRVDLEGFDRSLHSYAVCTSFGRDKAIALAAAAHERRFSDPSLKLYRVSSVSDLPGEMPEGLDLLDRNEW